MRQTLCSAQQSAQQREVSIRYALTGHIHQREVSRQLGAHVHFMPHVAPFFQSEHSIARNAPHDAL